MLKIRFIGLLAIGISSLGAEYYIKNNTKLNLGYDETVESNSSKFIKNASTELNFAGIFGQKKEVFTFVGGEANFDKDVNFGGGINLGVNLKKKLSKEVELILNAAYQYNNSATNKNSFEEAIKEMLKFRGEWKKEFEKDKEVLKEYYHSQGFRFKQEETLFSGVVGYDNDKFKLNTGLMYTAGYLNNGAMRFESFVNFKTRKLNHDIEFALSHKLRDHISTKGDKYTNGGRLKSKIKVSSKVGNLGTNNILDIYLGSIVPDGRDYKLTSENEFKYSINNLEMLTALNNELAFRQVKKDDKDLKIRLRPELRFELKYDNKKTLFESKTKVKGRVDLKKMKLDESEYEGNNQVTNNNTDISKVIGLVYTDNIFNYKLGIFDLKLSARYAGVVNMEKTKFKGYDQFVLVGPGITYANKLKNSELKHSFDIRYALGYKDNKTFSVINFWSDNKQEYKVNDKLSLKGELNFTSSNRFSFIDKATDKNEVLLLADTKVMLGYNISDKIEIISALGAKTISLFTEPNKASSQSSVQPSEEILTIQLSSDTIKYGDESLHLILQYGYKVFSENKIKYRTNKNVNVIGKLDASFSYGIKSDRLYESLTRIKRNRIGENGIETHIEEDLKKIQEEEKSFGDNKAVLSITPGVELEMKYLDDKLLIKSILEVNVSARVEKSKEYKDIQYGRANIKTGLNVGYRW
ncbi:hypothetical protein [Streptobacillus moniliformis]|uniref:hypothetical protein n=2 Tax=Streptobacillus moniliformis TaxID=34105 RepID=UPI0007E4391E|nr:hypothetical protein [Streptobacillus moniliformis]